MGKIIDKVKSWFPFSPFKTSQPFKTGTTPGSIFYNMNDPFGFVKRRYDEFIEEGYASNNDLYAIVSRINQKSIDLPVKFYRKVNEDFEEVTEGPEINFWKMPNPKQDQKEFAEACLNYLNLTGNIIINKVTPIGFNEISEVFVHPTQKIQIQAQYDPQFFSYQPTTYDLQSGQYIQFMPEEIIHVRLHNPTNYGVENYFGLSPLQAGFLTMIASNNMNQAEASMLKNKGIAGILSNDTDQVLTPTQKKQFDEAFQLLTAGTDNFGRIQTSGAKVKFTQLGMSMSDLKILESGIIKKRQFCDLYFVDSSILNDPANKKFNNLKEGEKAFILNACLPKYNRYLDIYNDYIFPTLGNGDVKVKVDKEKIEVLQEDQGKRIEKARKMAESISSVSKAVAAGEMSRDSGINIVSLAFGLNTEEAELLISEESKNEE